MYGVSPSARGENRLAITFSAAMDWLYVPNRDQQKRRGIRIVLVRTYARACCGLFCFFGDALVIQSVHQFYIFIFGLDLAVVLMMVLASEGSDAHPLLPLSLGWSKYTDTRRMSSLRLRQLANQRLQIYLRSRRCPRVNWAEYKTSFTNWTSKDMEIILNVVITFPWYWKSMRAVYTYHRRR